MDSESTSELKFTLRSVGPREPRDGNRDGGEGHYAVVDACFPGEGFLWRPWGWP